MAKKKKAISRVEFNYGRVKERATALSPFLTIVTEKEKFINQKVCIELHCSKHDHVFCQTIDHFIRKSAGCPLCSSGNSLSEEICRSTIQQLFWGKYKFSSAHPDWLYFLETGRYLELDGYCEELGIAFEYQGPHHHQPYFLVRDRFKAQECERMGVLLLTYEAFPAFTDLESIESLMQLLADDMREKILKWDASLSLRAPGKVLPRDLNTGYDRAPVLEAAQKLKIKPVDKSQILASTVKVMWVCTNNPQHKEQFLLSPDQVFQRKSEFGCKYCARMAMGRAGRVKWPEIERLFEVKGLKSWGSLISTQKDYELDFPVIKINCNRHGPFEMNLAQIRNETWACRQCIVARRKAGATHKKIKKADVQKLIARDFSNVAQLVGVEHKADSKGRTRLFIEIKCLQASKHKNSILTWDNLKNSKKRGKGLCSECGYWQRGESRKVSEEMVVEILRKKGVRFIEFVGENIGLNKSVIEIFCERHQRMRKVNLMTALGSKSGGCDSCRDELRSLNNRKPKKRRN